MSEASAILRPLMIDDEARHKAALVMSYARRHIYYLGDPPPGDNPRYVCHLNSYRCVFSYTKSPQTDALYRHLSISVPSKYYPHPVPVGAIAELFGFTKADRGLENRVQDGDWFVRVEKEEPHCIVLLEELKD